MIDTIDARLEKLRDSFGLRTTTGRLAEDVLKELRSLRIQVNEAAATTVYVIPGHHRWSGEIIE